MYDDTSAHMVDSAAADLSQLKPLQRRIYQAIAADQPDWPDGVDVEQVKQRCRNIDPDEFKCVVRVLFTDRQGRIGRANR